MSTRKKRTKAKTVPVPVAAPERPRVPRWTFLSNHAHVLLCLARQSDVRLRDVAVALGITERAVQKILADLEMEGLVERHREGRRNAYVLHLNQPMRHPIDAHHDVRELVELLLTE